MRLTFPKECSKARRASLHRLTIKLSIIADKNNYACQGVNIKIALDYTSNAEPYFITQRLIDLFNHAAHLSSFKWQISDTIRAVFLTIPIKRHNYTLCPLIKFRNFVLYNQNMYNAKSEVHTTVSWWQWLDAKNSFIMADEKNFS